MVNRQTGNHRPDESRHRNSQRMHREISGPIRRLAKAPDRLMRPDLEHAVKNTTANITNALFICCLSVCVKLLCLIFNNHFGLVDPSVYNFGDTTHSYSSEYDAKSDACCKINHILPFIQLVKNLYSTNYTVEASDCQLFWLLKEYQHH